MSNLSTSKNTIKKWLSILSGILTSSVCGMLFYSFSLLIKPLQAQFSWSYLEVSLGFSICYSFSSIFCFLSGRLISSIGAKRVSIAGSFLVSFGFLMCYFIKSKLSFYICYGVLAGIGSSFLYMTPLHTIPGWWPEKHVSMTGFAVVGLELGPFFMGPLIAYILKLGDLRQVF